MLFQHQGERHLNDIPRCSEILLSIPPNVKKPVLGDPSSSPFSTSTPARSQSPPKHSATFADRSPVPTQVLTQPTISLTPGASLYPRQFIALENSRDLEHEFEAQEEDVILTSHSYFEAREFYRINVLLKECKSAKAQFLRIYSQFLVCYHIIGFTCDVYSIGIRRPKKRLKEIGISSIVSFAMCLRLSKGRSF